jgi:DNA-directed RNA polymerase subunit RPC12/RpoP
MSTEMVVRRNGARVLVDLPWRKAKPKRPYSCPECNARCMNEHRLRIHQVTHHDRPARRPYSVTGGYTCLICKSGYATPSELSQHRRAIHSLLD